MLIAYALIADCLNTVVARNKVISLMQAACILQSDCNPDQVSSNNGPTPQARLVRNTAFRVKVDQPNDGPF